MPVVWAGLAYRLWGNLLSLVSRVPKVATECHRRILATVRTSSGLFGSYAPGQATPDSDIDIAVISPDFGKDYVEEAVMLKRISEDIELDISPRPYSLDEYRKASRGQFLYDEILRRGRPVDA